MTSVELRCPMYDGFHCGDLSVTLGRADLTHRRWVSPVEVLCCPALASVELRCPLSDGFHGGDSPATLGRADSTHQRWVSLVVVAGFDRNSMLGFNILSGGLISEGKRSVILEFVPRLVGPSFPDLFLEFLRTGSMGFGVSDQETNSFYSKELLSFPREVMLVKDADDFSVGFGETEVADCLPLQIIDPGVSTNLAELEEATEVLSIGNKLDISSWVKHRIPGFNKLVGLSTTRHEKLCIALLQRLETEMEATNVLHRRETSSKKMAKSKNKGRRELQNLICSVNYDRR